MKVKINGQNIDPKHVLQFVKSNEVSKIEIEPTNETVSNSEALLGSSKMSKTDTLHVIGIAIGVLGFLL